MRLDKKSKLLEKNVILENITQHNVANSAMIGLCFIIGLLFIWFFFVKINIITSAQGELLPLQRIKLAQHLDNSIVKHVIKHNGESVKKDELIMKISDQSSLTELNKLVSERDILALDKQRYEYYLGLTSNDDYINNELLNNKIYDRDLKAVYDREIKLFEAQYAAATNKQLELLYGLKQEENNLKRLEKEKPIIAEQLSAMKEEKKIADVMFADQISSKNEMLRTKREYLGMLAKNEEMDKDYENSKQRVQEIKHRIDKESAMLSESVMNKLLEADSKIIQLNQNIRKFKLKVSKLNIIAPVDGIINNLDVDDNAVIKSGQTILEIVPQGTHWEAEIKVSPEQIGQVEVRNPVQVKINTYDFAHFGSLQGSVKHISAGTFIDHETGLKYYKVIVTINNKEIPETMQLLAGMSVSADIISGQKGLWAHIVKPIGKLFG